MLINIITIFPQYFSSLNLALLGKAIKNKLLNIKIYDLRDFADNKHNSVDDRPYGGGPGMVMKADPWGLALKNFRTKENYEQKKKEPILIFPCPKGQIFNQKIAYEISRKQEIILACGRYEGIDERVYIWAKNNFNTKIISIGKYIVQGGEVASLVIIEAITRLLPGFLKNPLSLKYESYVKKKFLDYPNYTRPRIWNTLPVPKVLLTGHHYNIKKFRFNQSSYNHKRESFRKKYKK